jgi:hypothetical protein
MRTPASATELPCDEEPPLLVDADPEVDPDVDVDTGVLAVVVTTTLVVPPSASVSTCVVVYTLVEYAAVVLFELLVVWSPKPVGLLVVPHATRTGEASVAARREVRRMERRMVGSVWELRQLPWSFIGMAVNDLSATILLRMQPQRKEAVQA